MQNASTHRVIDWLLPAKTDTGWPINWVNTAAFAELCSSASHTGLAKGLAMKILGEMSTSNKKTVGDFEEIFEQQLKVNAIAASRQVDRWRFFIPIEVALSNDIVAQHPRIRILGRDFLFLSLSSVTRRLDQKAREALRNPTHIKFHTGVEVEHISEFFLTVSAQAPSWSLAWKDVAPAFDALRGLIECIL